MPELPEAKRQRYLALGVRDYDAGIIAYDVALANFFDAASAQASNPQAIANWLNGDISGWLNAYGLTISAAALTPALLTELIALIADGTISGKTAKELLPEVMQGAAPSRLVEARGLKQVSDSTEIVALVEAVIANNPAIVATIKANPKAVNALLGQVMHESRGKANPELVRALLNNKLGLG
jgi:aspartyl-tRNA(Asn)/glutamyl-tRNA(Gln) amidotransferase subunit B